ncbi:hypothetical protein EV697_1087 [Bisgaardia hudsonensis]|uniref:Lipoprotein n=1 Tax=Bisgaardia hudsonensis TaxID=109472 RepID=A0A4R2MRB4_9PAST|nr:hypothetical protein [Bisgaardia hudsonensis]QLB12869.1 hypothetical protein A6A11_04230 [Bisgaardia hudsonensis]TCP11284.1 hypothetical protein EV697_1087 [Bisgaardia hudsonensis]
MKRFFILAISFSVLSGCMTSRDPLVWFWNNGFKMSDKEREVYRTCRKEASKFYNGETQGELWAEFARNCRKEKGY